VAEVGCYNYCRSRGRSSSVHLSRGDFTSRVGRAGSLYRPKRAGSPGAFLSAKSVVLSVSAVRTSAQQFEWKGESWSSGEFVRRVKSAGCRSKTVLSRRVRGGFLITYAAFGPGATVRTDGHGAGPSRTDANAPPAGMKRSNDERLSMRAAIVILIIFGVGRCYNYKPLTTPPEPGSYSRCAHRFRLQELAHYLGPNVFVVRAGTGDSDGGLSSRWRRWSSSAGNNCVEGETVALPNGTIGVARCAPARQGTEHLAGGWAQGGSSRDLGLHAERRRHPARPGRSRPNPSDAGLETSDAREGASRLERPFDVLSAAR